MMMVMNSASKTLLLILILIAASAFDFSYSQLMYNEMGEQIEFVSGGDVHNVGGEILTKFRFLFGLHASELLKLKYSLSPAPALSEEEGLTPAPSPVPFQSHHVYTSLHPKRNPAPHYSENGRGRRVERARIRKIVIAVTVSAGSIFAFVVFLVCNCRRRRRRNMSSSNCKNKVNYDPDSGPELFYLNSLAPAVDIESKLSTSQSKTVLSNESFSGYSPSCEEEIHLNYSTHSCESEKVLLNEEMSSPNQCKSGTSGSCLDEEILEVEPPTSENESFHSVCNSRDSFVSEFSFSCASGKCSPFNNSNESNSPIIKLTTYFSTVPPPTSLTLTNSISLKPKTKPSCSKSPASSIRSSHSSTCSKDNTETELSSRFKPVNNICITKPTTLSESRPSSISNEKIPRPPSNPTPSNSKGCIPKPPPPPLPPIGTPSSQNRCNSGQPPPPPPLPPFQPPSSQNGSNSRQPPPPPPFQFQQSTPTGKDGTPLAKLKPLHWDKVRAAPDRSMVWDKIKSSSFELDEQMIESLFSYKTQSSAKTEEAKAKSSSPGKHVLDNKRLQNITILLKALNATSGQVCEALIQGRGLGTQQLEALAKMVPTKEEEEKLFNYVGDTNELGSAEIFVKAILNIPFAFSRIQVMLYKETFEDEVVHLKKSFAMLEEACKELRSSRLFFRLLEAVLKTGNRMNVGTIRGGARAFKLDTLLKLADVKGTDGKTTLLHFVVQEIIRSEGVTAMEKSINRNKPKTDEEREEGYRVMGLDIVSGLSRELCNVKKTASIDLDVLASSVTNLTEGMNQMKQLIEVDLTIRESERNKRFANSMKTFLISAERTITELKEDENRVLVNVKEITEYYHGDVSKDEANPLRIFVIVRDFLTMLDRVCKEVRSLKGVNPAIWFR